MPPKQPRPAGFWRWLFRGIDSQAGIWRLLNWWSLAHILVGGVMTLVVPVSLKEAASVILLPLAGVFIGLSFTWVGNAQAILSEERTKAMARHAWDGYLGLAYTFQLIVLVLLVVLSLWAIAGMGVFDETWPGRENVFPYRLMSAFLYAFASLAVRGCWHAVFGSQFLLLAPYLAERMRAEMEAEVDKER